MNCCQICNKLFFLFYMRRCSKGAGGRGLLKPPAWESTPEGVAAGQAAAITLARRLHGTACQMLPATSSTRILSPSFLS